MIQPKVRVYATVRLCKGAQGEISLFTVPQGQYMPMLTMGEGVCSACKRPTWPGEVLTEKHTNICKAGEFGTAIGDCAFTSVKAAISAAAVPNAEFKLRVAGRMLFVAPLAKMLAGLAGPEFLERTCNLELRDHAILVARTDCFEGRLYVNSPIEEDTYVRVEFE